MDLFRFALFRQHSVSRTVGLCLPSFGHTPSLWANCFCRREVRPRNGAGEAGEETVLDTSPKLETAIFSALCVFQQERLDTRTWVVVYRLLLDYLQVLLLVLQPSFGWNINSNLW